MCWQHWDQSGGGGAPVSPLAGSGLSAWSCLGWTLGSGGLTDVSLGPWVGESPGKRLVTARKGCRSPSSPQALQPSPQLLCSSSEGAGVGEKAREWEPGDHGETPAPPLDGSLGCGRTAPGPETGSGPARSGERATQP